MEALIKKIAQGDEQALAGLHRLMHQRIIVYVSKLLDDSLLAEEVMLETLFEVWNHAGQFTGEAKASTWILGIARHKALDKRRRLRPDFETLAFEHLEISSCEISAFDAVDAAQRRAALQDCINQLPLLQQECMQLAFYQELAVEQIAKLQGSPNNTVKTRMFHARQKLKRCLKARGHGAQS